MTQKQAKAAPPPRRRRPRGGADEDDLLAGIDAEGSNDAEDAKVDPAAADEADLTDGAEGDVQDDLAGDETADEQTAEDLADPAADPAAPATDRPDPEAELDPNAKDLDPEAPDPADPMAADAEAEQEWSGDVDESGDETDPAESFAAFAGPNGEEAWLDRDPDGTLTGWVRDADGTVRRYSDPDMWATDVDDAAMQRNGGNGPDAPAEPDPAAVPPAPGMPPGMEGKGFPSWAAGRAVLVALPRAAGDAVVSAGQ